MIDTQIFIDNLKAKGYRGGRELIVYLISQGKCLQDMIDICLEQVDPKYSVCNLKLN
jgi:hypothetical protein